MSSTRPDDSAAHYIHGGLYHFDKVAVDEVRRRLQQEIDANQIPSDSVSLVYHHDHYFILQCDQDAGPVLDQALREILSAAQLGEEQDGKVLVKYANVRRFLKSMPSTMRDLLAEDDDEAVEKPLVRADSLIRAYHAITLCEAATDDDAADIYITFAVIASQALNHRSRAQQPRFSIQAVQKSDEDDTLQRSFCARITPSIFPVVEYAFTEAARSTEWIFDLSRSRPVAQPPHSQGREMDKWLSHLDTAVRGASAGIPDVSAIDLYAGSGYTQIQHKDAESDDDNASDQSFTSAVDEPSLLPFAGDESSSLTAQAQIPPSKPSASRHGGLSDRLATDSDSDDEFDLNAMIGKPKEAKVEQTGPQAGQGDEAKPSQREDVEFVRSSRRGDGRSKIDKFGLIGHAEGQASWVNEGRQPSMALNGDEWDTPADPSQYPTPSTYEQTIIGGAQSWARRRPPLGSTPAYAQRIVATRSTIDWPSLGGVPAPSYRRSYIASADQDAFPPLPNVSTRNKPARSDTRVLSIGPAAGQVSVRSSNLAATSTRPREQARQTAVLNPDEDLIDLFAAAAQVVDSLRTASPPPTLHRTMNQKAKKAANKSKTQSTTAEGKRTTKDPPPSGPAKQEAVPITTVPALERGKQLGSTVDICLQYFRTAQATQYNNFHVSYGRAEIEIDKDHESIADKIMSCTEANIQLSKQQWLSSFAQCKLSTQDAVAAFGLCLDVESSLQTAVRAVKNILLITLQWHEQELFDVELDLESMSHIIRPRRAVQRPLHIHIANAAVDVEVTTQTICETCLTEQELSVSRCIDSMQLQRGGDGPICVLTNDNSQLKVLSLQHVFRFSRDLARIGNPVMHLELTRDLTISENDGIISAQLGSAEQMKSDGKLYWRMSMDFVQLELTAKSVNSFLRFQRKQIVAALTGILLPEKKDAEIKTKVKQAITPFW